MAQIQRGSRARQKVLLLAATAVTLITLDFRGFGPVGWVRSTLGTVLQPIVSVTGSATSPLGDLWNGVTNYQQLKDENAELRTQLAEVEGETVREENAQAQLADLTAQMDIDLAPEIDGIPARVISGPVANFDYSIRVDRGSADGISSDMPVISPSGLVGRIGTVTPNTAVVELLDSLDFAVGVRVVGSYETFVARGQGRGEALVVAEEMSPDSRIREKASVVTSGLAQSIFPGDIPVGRIAGLSGGPQDAVGNADVPPISDIKIEPFTDLDQQSFVTILRWTPAVG